MFAELADSIAAAATLPVAAGILANGVEELIMDAQYFGRRLHLRERRRITVEELDAAPVVDIAIMVAAWHEAEVIGRMLEHNVSDLDYDVERYTIFCGTYANDPQTQAKVDEVRGDLRNVRKVVVPHDGPTSKADCLNWIYQGIVLEEQERGRRFDILVMHDAEDVIHPLSLKLYAFLIPPNDFVQIPVFSLDRRLGALVGGTYIDEFGEHHQKEMLVREAIGGLVPSAGVGSAFARDAFETIAAANHQKPFNTESLTEDYEIALKFRLAGMRSHFACRSLQRTTEVRGRLLPFRREVVAEELIATREYFPNRFAGSVRQRGRWIVGIALQTWRQIGWRGDVAVRYCLWRDRKVLLTNALVLGAYVLVLYVAARAAIAALGGPGWRLASIAPRDSMLWCLLGINLGVLAWRMALKAYFVNRLYGPWQAATCVPRLIVGNVVSLFATGRAVVTYLRHRITRVPLRWAKTDHEFPSTEVLRKQRRRLGEFLVAGEQVSAEDVERALELQRGTDLKLGEVLAACGMVSQREVVRALSAQLEMSAVDLAPYEVPLSLLRELPEMIAVELGAVPVSIDGGGRPLIAMAERPDDAQLATLERHLGARPSVALADAAAIRQARWRAYRRLLGDEGGGPRIGERLIELAAIGEASLTAALAEQRETGELLGELLMRWQLIGPDQLSAVLPPGLPPYVALRPSSIDVDALRSLGYGLTSFYLLAPMRGADHRLTVACPYPVHPLTAAEIRRRLGEPIALALSSGFDARVSLAIAGQAAWPRHAHIDSAELAVIRTEPDLAARVFDIGTLSRLLGVSPLEALQASSRTTPEQITALRARTHGLEVASRYGVVRDHYPAIPPELASRHQIRTESIAGDGVILASPKPTARLAHQVADLFVNRAVAWTVYQESIASEEYSSELRYSA